MHNLCVKEKKVLTKKIKNRIFLFEGLYLGYINATLVQNTFRTYLELSSEWILRELNFPLPYFGDTHTHLSTLFTAARAPDEAWCKKCNPSKDEYSPPPTPQHTLKSEPEGY